MEDRPLVIIIDDSQPTLFIDLGKQLSIGFRFLILVIIDVQFTLLSDIATQRGVGMSQALALLCVVHCKRD